MKIKIALFIIIINCCIYNYIYSSATSPYLFTYMVHNIREMNDAECLKDKELLLGGIIHSNQAFPIMIGNNNYDSFSNPIFYLNFSSLIPHINVGFGYARGFKNNIEFGFSALIGSPKIFYLNVRDIPIISFVYFKKGLYEKNDLFISYKIDNGFELNIPSNSFFSTNLIIKNSISFTKKHNNINYFINTYIQNSLLITPAMKFAIPTTIITGFELGTSKIKNNLLIYISTDFYYEANLDLIYYFPNYITNNLINISCIHNFNFTFNIGFYYKYRKIKEQI